MRAAMELGGYTASEADSLRKVISKKKAKELDIYRNKFVEGAVKNGIDRATAKIIFQDWEGFAHYGFNKSHAADYGVIAVQTAFLKTHFPIEYMTALLSQSKHDTDKVALYTAEARALGIDVLSPDVNNSGWDFEIEEMNGRQAIRFGLGAIKNVGQGPVDTIVAAREDGPFSDLNDFVRRVDLRKVGRRAFESIIRVGAMDSLGDRRALLMGMDRVCAISESHFRAEESGQLTFFGAENGLKEEIRLPKIPPLESREKLDWERELLGLYLSDHPLSPFMAEIKQSITHYSSQLAEVAHDTKVTVAGAVDEVRTIVTRNGKEMAFVTVEDLQGLIDLVVFPRVWQKNHEILRSNSVLLIRGKLDNERSEPKVLVNRIEVMKPSDKELPEIEHDEIQVIDEISGLDDELSESSGVFDEADDLEVNHIIERMVEKKDMTSLGLEQTEGAVASSVLRETSQESQTSYAPDFPALLLNSALKISEPDYVEDSVQKKETIRSTLVVHLRSSGVRDRDIRRIRQIYNLLTSLPGDDGFAFECLENGHSIRLDFPNDRTSISESLQNELKGIVGDNNFHIE